MSFQTMPSGSPWASLYGGTSGQFPAMASGVPSGTTAGLPASTGFPARGVPSTPAAAIPGASLSTSPFSFGSNLQQLPGQVAAGVTGAEQAALPYYTSGIGALQKYYGQGLPYYSQGQQYYGAAAQPFNTLLSQSDPATQQYMAALGLGGPTEQAAAINAFMASPQLQSGLELGGAAIKAQQAATGGTGSGNELIALDKYNQQLGSQLWNQYLGQLYQAGPQQATTAAQGLAGIASGQAGLSAQQAQYLAGLGGGVSGGLNTIGGMMYGAPMTALNYITQGDIGAENASSANLAALTGLGSGLLSAGGLLGGAYMLSDVKAKENIEPVGKLADDQTVYRYNYRGDPTPHIGLIAQEVEQVAPDAVVDLTPDLKGVDYARATDRAAALMQLANDNVATPLIIYDGLMERAAA